MAAVYGTAPREMAARLLAEHDEEWVDELAVELDRQRSGRELARLMRQWNLSRTELGELFGISRQAVTKWLSEGVPADRAEVVADVAAITDALRHHIKQDRLPAVVRRRAPGLDGMSLIELVATGRSADALRATRQMFVFGDLHG